MANASITVQGLDVTLRALKIIDPEAMKALRVGFKDAATPVLETAKAQVRSRPISGWGGWGGRLDYSESDVRRGLRSQVSVTRSRAAMRLVNSNAAGAVFETAGSRNPGSQFNKVLIARYGDAPRLLVRTWKQEKGIRQTYTAVGRLIADAERRVQDAVGA
jgi:hypothetical protein